MYNPTSTSTNLTTNYINLSYLQLPKEHIKRTSTIHEPQKTDSKEPEKKMEKTNKQENSNENKIDTITHISIKLANKAGKIVVLEIARQNDFRKFNRLPHHKTMTNLSPRYYRIQGRIIDEIICL